MDPDDGDKTAIITPFGLGWFGLGVTVFPKCNLGVRGPLRQVPACWMWLKDVPSSSCVHYSDDVVVHGTNFEEVLDRLDIVLTRLHDAGLTLKA